MRYLILIWCLWAGSLYAQDSETKLIDSKIILDGNLDETVWNKGSSITGFRQLFPSLSDPAVNVTEVRILYDKEAIYVGIENRIPPGGDVFASVLERDQPLDADDYIEVIIDTYNDKTNALAFRTNPLGNRFDYEIGDNGAYRNISWSTFWDVATAVSSYGWTAEFRIPFSSLRFSSSTATTMGIKIIRQSKWNNERVIYPLNNSELDNVAMNMINSEEILFRNIENKKPLYITPYVIANVSQVSQVNNSGTGYNTSTDLFNQKGYAKQKAVDQLLSNVGLDIKYKPSQNSTLDVSLNTDFAQAEADDRIINLSRFSITLPEKRLFFLENANLFSFDMFGEQLFYTRRIGIETGVEIPLIGGIRYTGSTNGWQYGVLNIQGNGSSTNNIEAKNYAIARIRKQVGRNGSYVGGMLTNQISTESGNVYTAGGLDGLYWFSDLVRATYWITSNFENGQTNLDQTSYGVRLSKFPSSGYRFDLRYRDFREGFNPSLGFLSRPNTKRLTINNGYSFRFNDHPWLSQFLTGGYVTHYWVSSTNQMQFFQANMYSYLNLINGFSFRAFAPLYQADQLFTPWQFTDEIIIPAATYTMWKAEPYFTIGDGYHYTFEVDGTIGEFYGGHQLSIRPSVGYVFNRYLNLEAGINYNRIRFPSVYSSTGDTKDRRLLYTGHIGYTFTPATSLKVFLQYDNKSHLMGSNIRIRYNPKEGVNLYLIVNHNLYMHRAHFQPERPLIQSQGVILKYSHTFNY